MKKILLVILLTLLVGGCSIGEYEGKTAQEWADYYNRENTDRINLQNEYNNLESEKDDLQDEYDSLQNEYDDLQGCVEDYPHDAEYNCI